MVVKASDPIKLGHELTNIQLGYEALHCIDLVQKDSGTNLNDKQLMYEQVTHHKMIKV